MKHKDIDESKETFEEEDEIEIPEELLDGAITDIQKLAQLIRQEKLREDYELHDKVAVLNCEVCQQWEKHFDFYPHKQIPKEVQRPMQLPPEEPRHRIGFRVDDEK